MSTRRRGQKNQNMTVKARPGPRKYVESVWCAALILLLCVSGCAAEGADQGNEADSAEGQEQGEATKDVDIDELKDTLLHDEDPDERWWAAAALGKSADARGIPALTRALKEDQDADVRSQAAWALGQIGDTESVDELVQVLQEDEGEDVRRQAARALGHIGDTGAVDELSRALHEDKAPYVRHHAAWALGQIGSDAAVEPLIEALKDDPSAYVRHDVAAALGAIGDERSIDPLVGALEDGDVKVRWEAVKALAKIAEAAVEPLTAMVREGQGDSAWFAAFSLEMIGTAETRAEVDRILEQEGIRLEEVSENYKEDWPYEAIVLALERHGTEEMAKYYRGRTPDQFEGVDAWLVVVEAAEDWSEEAKS